jgi:hypothetical protein
MYMNMNTYCVCHDDGSAIFDTHRCQGQPGELLTRGYSVMKVCVACVQVAGVPIIFAFFSNAHQGLLGRGAEDIRLH